MYALKHHVLTHSTIISFSLSINPNSTNTVLIKRLIYGFNNNLVSSKRPVFMTGFFILPVSKENKLLIKLSTSHKIRRLDHKFLIKLFWTWKMSKEDLSFILKKAEKCKFIKFLLTQYFLMKVHIRAQHSKMLSMRLNISKTVVLIQFSYQESLREIMENFNMVSKDHKLHQLQLQTEQFHLHF